MVFNDYVESSKKIYDLLLEENMVSYIENLKNISEKYEEYVNTVVIKLATVQTYSSSNERIGAIDNFRSLLLKFQDNTAANCESVQRNALYINELLTQSITESMVQEQNDIMSEFKAKFLELTNKFTEMAFTLDPYKRVDLYIKLQGMIRGLTSIYEAQLGKLKYAISIGDELSGIDEYQDSEGLERLKLTFYGESSNYQYMIDMMDSTYKIHDKVCNFYSLTTERRRLIPLKIESGSWYQDLIADPLVVNVVSALIVCGMKNAYSYFAKKRTGNENLKDYLKENMDIKKIISEQDAKVDDRHTSEEALEVVFKSLSDIAYKNNKVKVNECTINFSADIGESKLLEFDMKYLENKKDLDS